MKLIFLDIDGVLVTRRPGVMEDRLLANLARVVERTGASIVLSSDWRRHPLARSEAHRVLATHGLSFIACTPCMSIYLAQRPTEIMQWKRDYMRSPSAEHITHWVAIDDRHLLEEKNGKYLRGHFVQTHLMHGLTETAADECIRILNAESSARPPDDRPLDASFESPGREGLFEGVGRRHVGAGGVSARGQSASPGLTSRQRATSLLGERCPPPPSIGGAGDAPLYSNATASLALGASAPGALSLDGSGRSRGRSHPPSYGQRRGPGGVGRAAGR